MNRKTSPISKKTIRGIILDMDGVLWRGEQLLADIPQVFRDFSQLEWRVLLATNNSTSTIAGFTDTFRKLGVQLEPWQVINSAAATSRYLRRQFPEGGTVFVIGEAGLRATVAGAGFPEGDQQPLAVVVGLDRGLSYAQLARATLLIRSGVPFIATNPDKSFPTPEGQVPGAGAIVTALEAASGVPATIIGKPAPVMFRQALERLGTSPSETLVIGDRLETDIAGGINVGCKTALVLSGVTDRNDPRLDEIRPDWIFENLSELVQFFKDEHPSIHL